MDFDLIVIGGGPGGYTAAGKAAASGLKTLLVDRAELGGTCLNRGCIPTKAFCRSAEIALDTANAGAFGVRLPEGKAEIDMAAIVERKNQVVKQLHEGVAWSLKGVEILHGQAKFTGPNEIEVANLAIIANEAKIANEANEADLAAPQHFSSKRIIVATGSKSAMLPIPGAELCLTSTELLDIKAVPESLCIIGGGVIGLEFASIFSAFGSKVTVIEFCKEILPGFDKDIAKRLRQALAARGITFFTQAAATAVERTSEGLKVSYTAKNKPAELIADEVLMAVGRRPVIPEGLVEAGAETTPRGIVTDDNLQTTIPGVYAIGDCNGRCLLAHAAEAQADRVVDHLIAEKEAETSAGTPLKAAADKRGEVIPAAVFTIPEAAMVGATEEQLKEQGIPYKAVKIPLRSNGKALTMGATDGMLKLLISREAYILGCHILGPHASDLIMEATLAMTARIPVSQIKATIHPHPTLSELFRSAL